MTSRLLNYSLAIFTLVALSSFSIIFALTANNENASGTIYFANTLLLTLILVWQFIFTGKSEDTEEDNSPDLSDQRLNMALNFQALGKLDTAYQIYKQCIPSQKIITLLSNLAGDYLIVGNTNQAIKVYKYALSLQPSNSSIKIKLASIENHGSDVSNTTKKLIVNRYQPIKLIGKGSQSSVYLASDLQSNQELTALKVLKINTEQQNELDEELYKRFLREAETASSLNHPNIVRIVDSGQSAKIAYIAMEYIAGKTLREHADSTTLLPVSLVLELISQCADGLDYAHTQGIVHRDVKPANILFDSNKKIAKLGDFGIARIANSTQTLAGAMLGTPYYMSPEQLVGLEFNARSDIFSLGATLFRLLSGTTPFKGNSMAELMRAIVNEPHQDLAHIRPNLPTCVIKLIDSCLEKDPKYRYTSAGELSAELKICAQQIKS